MNLEFLLGENLTPLRHSPPQERRGIKGYEGRKSF